jgi:alcohol dehydrogenase
MNAVVLQEGNRIAIENVPDPTLVDNQDIIVKVTCAAICGSDIHAMHGVLPGVNPGIVIGHEFVGIVDAAGTDVRRFKVGDRVAVAAATWCGTCSFCRRGEFQYCLNGGVWGGGEIFGKGLAGAQAEYVRVPYADNCVEPIPDNVTDEEAVFVGDVFSTGFHAAYEGQIKVGDTVVVFGCGPIGLAALISAWQFGASRVIGIDMMENRLQVARTLGAETVDARQGSVVESIREMTGGFGADVVIEAVGNPQALQQALKVVRRGGRMSVVGLFSTAVEIPLNELVYHGVNIYMGLGNLGRMSALMRLLSRRRVDLKCLVTHEFPLLDAEAAYWLFAEQKEDCIKVLLKP